MPVRHTIPLGIVIFLVYGLHGWILSHGVTVGHGFSQVFKFNFNFLTLLFVFIKCLPNLAGLQMSATGQRLSLTVIRRLLKLNSLACK